MARPSEPLVPGRGGPSSPTSRADRDPRDPPSLADLHLVAKHGKPIPLVFGPALVAPVPIYSVGTGGQKVVAARTGDGGAAVREHVDAQTADVIFALGEAPFAEAPTSVIRGRDRIPGALYTSLADLVAPAVGLQTAGSLEWTTAVDPAPWARLNVAAAGQAFRGAAQGRAHKLAMIDGRLPDLRVPVRGLCWDAALGGANAADVILYLLGRAGIPASAVEVDLGLDGLAASSYRRYVTQAPWPVGRAISEQTSIREVLDQLLLATNSTITKSQAADGSMKLKAVPLGDRAVGTYAPPATAAVLDDDELLYEKGKSPVDVEIVPDEQVYNAWPITIVTLDGTSSTYEWIYAAHAAERAARYGGDGVRRAKATAVPWLVRPEDAIRLSMLWALRSVHVRNGYRVRVGPRWGLLEPGDYVQLRQSHMEIDALCRIRSIDLRERGRRELLLQEVPEGVATPVDLTPQAREGLTGTPVSSTVPELVGNRATTYSAASAPAAGALRVGDIWRNTDTTTACPAGASCKGTLGDDGVQRSPATHRAVGWPHRWTGTAWVDDESQALTIATELAPGVTKTDPYVETTGTVYPEGTTGTYATSGAKLHNRGDPATVTPVLVAATGIRVGRWRLDELVVRAANALARPLPGTNHTYYRGNSFGAPVLMDPPWVSGTVYSVGSRVTSAGNVYVLVYAGANPTIAPESNPGYWGFVGTIASQERIGISSYSAIVYGTNIVRVHKFTVVVKPRTNDDNLDALCDCTVTLYGSSGGAQLDMSRLALPSRRYVVPGTPGNEHNQPGVTFEFIVNGISLYHHNPAPSLFNGYARFRVSNALGFAARDFGQAVNTQNADWPGGAAIPGLSAPDAPVADPDSGGACPAPETPILLPGGITAPAGALAPGDSVWTLPEDGGPWAAYRVTHVSRHRSRRVLLVVDEAWRVELAQEADEGDVMKITVEGAHTYVIACRRAKVSPMHRVASSAAWHHTVDLRPGDQLRSDVPGILSHNAKPRDP